MICRLGSAQDARKGQALPRRQGARIYEPGHSVWHAVFAWVLHRFKTDCSAMTLGFATDSASESQNGLAWATPKRFALLLSLFIFATFPEVLLGTRTFFYRDYGALAYPAVAHHHERFWRGEVPLWNPLNHCGVPFLAQWGTMVLYPP